MVEHIRYKKAVSFVKAKQIWKVYKVKVSF